MNKRLSPQRIKKLVFDTLYDCGTLISSYFDRSFTSGAVGVIRGKAMALSIRVIGSFLFTFGAYSFLIALLFLLFTKQEADTASLFGGALLALSSLPLFFSKGTVSTCLTESSAGRIICDYFDIRREALSFNAQAGHISIGFILGVLMSAATIVIPFGTVLNIMASALILSLVLARPETGLTFFAVLFFATDIRLHCVIICATCASFLFKVIRSKRRIVFRRTDFIFLILFASTLGAFLFCTDGRARDGAFLYVLLLLVYLLTVSLLRDCRRIIKLLSCGVLCAGALASFYLLGFAVQSVAPLLGAADKGYLLRLVCSFSAFELGFAPIAFSVLIPVATAFILKPKNEGYRFTMILCLASMITCLVLCGEFACLIPALGVTAVLLLITGSRRIYLALSAILCAAVVISFAGPVGDRIFGYIYDRVYEAYHQAESLGAAWSISLGLDLSIAGQGFSQHGLSGTSFYHSLISQTGFFGLVIFWVFVTFIILQAAGVILRTYRSHRLSEGIGYLSSRDNREETRMGMLAALSSLFVLLLIGGFYDFYECYLSYMLLFWLCGICTAFARSANLEFIKAQSSVTPQATKTHASLIVTRSESSSKEG